MWTTLPSFNVANFNGKSTRNFQSSPEKCSEVLAASSESKTHSISLGMFYGPSSQPSLGSLEEILVPISEMYLAILVPFGDHKC